MKKLESLVITAVFLALAVGTVLPPVPTAVAQQAENNIEVLFRTAWVYESPEDIFTNGQVTGYKWWSVGLRNNEDDTKAPVSQLSLKLESALDFDSFSLEGLVLSGPPVYEWFYGDIPEGASAGPSIDSSRSKPVPIAFTPGFDASRSVDKSVFQEENTQTVTITLTPRETVEGFGIRIQAEENDVVNPVITSPISGKGINLSSDGHSLNIQPDRLQLNKEWTTTITIKVAPKVPFIQYMPYILIESEEAVSSGTTSGSNISKPVGDPKDEVGTWAWHADGNCRWYWEEHLSKRVNWLSLSTRMGGSHVAIPGVKGNQVWVAFADTLSHSLPYWVDGFTNAEVSGERMWRISHTENIKDETGEPVRGLKITLDSDLVFDSVGGWGVLTTKMGPPTYEWFYGDLSEDYTGHPKDANVMLRSYGELTKFTPGFDVSRFFDKTVFTAPDTQTVVVTFTKREETFERVLITVGTEAETDLVDAIIVAHSEEWYNESGSDEHCAEFGPRGTGIPVELNTPLKIFVTIQVTPKVPEVVYKPHVHVAPYYPGGEKDRGTVQGSSFSLTGEVGTWTVSADGNYIWSWIAPGPTPRGSVDLASSRGHTKPEFMMSWSIFYGIVVAVIVIIGLVTFFFIRRRRRRATQ